MGEGSGQKAKRIKLAGLGLVPVLAASAMLASTASNAAAVKYATTARPDYVLSALPELGRCVAVAPKTGNFGNHCLKHKPGKGKYDWMPVTSGEALLKFDINISSPVITSSGAHAVTIACAVANGEGEYTGPKTFTVSKLLFEGCQNPAVTGEKTWCQKTLSERGLIEATGLSGEVGLITAPKHLKAGFSLAGTIAFECEGYIELLSHGTGTGTMREIEGSVIGRVTAIDRMEPSFKMADVVQSGKQVPERFQGEEKDTLTTVVTVPSSAEKTPEPTALSATASFANEQALEIKAKCKGTGC